MPVPCNGQFEVLTEADVERIYRLVDGLGLDRDYVIIPLMCAERGLEMQQPDGRIIVRPPGDAGFEGWIGGLADRLSALDLGRVQKVGEDRNRIKAAPFLPHWHGTRTYLGEVGHNPPAA